MFQSKQIVKQWIHFDQPKERALSQMQKAFLRNRECAAANHELNFIVFLNILMHGIQEYEGMNKFSKLKHALFTIANERVCRWSVSSGTPSLPCHIIATWPQLFQATFIRSLAEGFPLSPIWDHVSKMCFPYCFIQGLNCWAHSALYTHAQTTSNDIPFLF